MVYNIHKGFYTSTKPKLNSFMFGLKTVKGYQTWSSNINFGLWLFDKDTHIQRAITITNMNIYAVFDALTMHVLLQNLEHRNIHYIKILYSLQVLISIQSN